MDVSFEAVNITLFTDNKSLYETVHSTKSIEDKRLKIDICILRQVLSNGEIHSIEWVETKKQIADSLTKGGASTKKLLDILNGVDDGILCIKSGFVGRD